MRINLDLSVTIRMPEIVDAIRGLTAAVVANTQTETSMSAQLDALQQQVQTNNTLIGSAITLIQGLADQIAANMNDPAALQQLVDDLRAQDDALSQAITANTPASPAAQANP